MNAAFLVAPNCGSAGGGSARPASSRRPGGANTGLVRSEASISDNEIEFPNVVAAFIVVWVSMIAAVVALLE